MDRHVQTELDLVGCIYDAALAPELWSDAIDRIRRHLGLEIAAIGMHFNDGVRHSIEATSNVSPEAVQILAETAPTIFELWGGADAIWRMPVEEPIRMLDYSSPAIWTGNPFYERFCRPLGLVDQIALIIERSSNLLATLGLGVHESMPPIDDRQMAIAGALAPHLRRAVNISNLLESRSIAMATFEAALDSLGSAVLLVDANARIVHANELAENMLRTGDPITQIGGRLDVPGELVKGHLERTIAAAASAEESLSYGAGLPVRRADGSNMVIHVLPLPRRSTRPRSLSAVAAIFVAPPDRELKLPTEALRLLYELSPSELRVLELIAAGKSGKAVANALKVSENTAKTHTTRLFDKVGVHSRTELLRVIREASSSNMLPT